MKKMYTLNGPRFSVSKCRFLEKQLVKELSHQKTFFL